MICLTYVFMISWLSASAPVVAQEPEIRILITRLDATAEATVTAPTLEYRTSNGQWTPASSNSVSIGPRITDAPADAASPLQLRAGSGLIEVRQGEVARTYRGTLEVTVSDSMKVINTVPLEQYLRGVIPSEMPPSFPLEALKAQAVAARSYTLAHLRRHEDSGADLCDSTHCHAYRGASQESEASDKALQETSGQVLIINGRILNSEYSADCGGHTCLLPQLGNASCVRDAPDGAPSYCSTNPRHGWELRLTQKDLLAAAGEARETPLRKITVVERDLSGRVDALVLHHDYGAARIDGATFRQKAGLRSLLCRFAADAQSGDIIITGTGHGHGRGLCQWGARGMAMAPHRKTYKDILAHYYPGAVLRKVDEPREP